MRFIKTILLFVLLSVLLPALASRTDSFSLSRTAIHLKIRNFTQKNISGFTEHTVHFKVPSDKIVFDLKQLTVDSVQVDNAAVTFERAGEKLSVVPGKTFQPMDSCMVRIWYRGTPAGDPSGWGGFYFSGDYAFNLGVGFAVFPHSYGRAWFPCVDEFGMKSAYDFYIETDSNYTAACNGLLISGQISGDARIWHYRENIPMSAYLVSVSVSKFSVLGASFAGMQHTFPISLYCRAADTARVRTSFLRLPEAIRAFEKAFGPQQFSKVGYNFVPFSSGAMEHAGNITYPQVFANGSSDYEELMAHELSHHWWGNNATCRTEGDMWLNEGWASYCEHFFTEQVYGKAAYRNSILQNHLNVLRFAHVNDANVFAMVNIPKEYTYGSHVYKKGADVVHSLRGIMGDSAFFEACRAYQKQYRLGTAATSDLENVFAAHGDSVQVRGFFAGLVYEKGFPHLYIRKQVHSGAGPFRIRIYTEQNPRFTDKPISHVPVEVFFFKSPGNYVIKRIVPVGLRDSFEFELDFKPLYVCLDYHEKLSDAITDRVLHTNQDGLYDMPEAFCKLDVKGSQDTALFRVEHHWVGPELYRTTAPYMSNYRYYTLDGIWDTTVSLNLELAYDGRKGGSGTGYLDHTLIFKTEDSLTVLYRGFPGDYWRPWKDLQFTYGSKSDKQGRVLVKNALKGDYVFAMYDHTLSAAYTLPALKAPYLVLRPVPATGTLVLELMEDNGAAALVTLVNSSGQTLLHAEKPLGGNVLELDISSIPEGVYTVCVYREGKQICSKITRCNN